MKVLSAERRPLVPPRGRRETPLRKRELPYLNDVFIGGLALDEGGDVGDGAVHLYGDHFDRDGHGASGQNGCVDDLRVLQGREEWRFMKENGFPGRFISISNWPLILAGTTFPEHLSSSSTDFTEGRFQDVSGLRTSK